MDATIKLLADRGAHGTSLDAVAEEVGISKSSILWHFGSKEGLLVRVAEEVFRGVAETRGREIVALERFEDRVEATWRMFAETIDKRPSVRRLIVHLIFESADGPPEIRERLQQLYREARELFEAGLRGVLPDQGQRERASVLAVATFDGVFLQWLLDPDAVDIAGLYRDATLLYRSAGLMDPKPLPKPEPS